MSGMLVHEWLERTGGSENVFEALTEIFPDAAKYCAWNASGGRFADVGETLIARTPLRGRKSLALPFMPAAWRMLPAVDADWVLCSSHAFSHQAKFRGRAGAAPKLVYVHTPARYVWVPELDGRGESGVARAVSAMLKPVDRRRAQEPVTIASNSSFVADRVRDVWNRDSTVIYPPVDVDYFSAPGDRLTEAEERLLESLPAQYVFGVSRLVPYKRLDRAIDVGAAVGLPVVIAGEGDDQARLESIAADRRVDARFIGRPSRALLARLYARALVVVFAPIEDFGIVPVEAMAAGAPVLANAVGGAAESVVDGVTGAIVHDWEATELVAAVETAVATEQTSRVARAREFDRATFDLRIREWTAPYTGWPTDG